jgi:hypothetical protein
MANFIDMWKRSGSGVGIEVQGNDLLVVAVKSRPSGVAVLGMLRVENFRERPAAEWGRDYAGLLKEHGLGHVSATVCLPRGEIVVRQLRLARKTSASPRLPCTTAARTSRRPWL